MNPIEKYFTAERWWCAGGMALGFLATAVALYCLLKIKQPYYNGLAWVLLVLGLFFFIICIGVFLRSPKDVARVHAVIEHDAAQLKQEELPRMERVMRTFKVIMVAEVSLLVLSVVMIWFVPVPPVWKGAFVGVLIMATLMLAFDYLADKRGAEYLEFLKAQVPV